MKKNINILSIYFLLLLLFNSITNFTLLNAKVNNHSNNNIRSKIIQNNKRKKITVFMCDGGGGHKSVSLAFQKYFGNIYDISVVNFFDIIASLDTVRFCTFGKVSGEDFYNFCLRYRLTKMANTFASIGAWGIRKKTQDIENLIYEYINQDKPDLIISVIPLVNGSILNVSEKLNIPFLVVTNDLDTSNYINGISNVTYKKFYYTLPFNDINIRNIIEKANIPNEQVIVTGFPLRPEFFQPKDKNAIYRDFKIPRDKPVIMLLSGGAGSYTSYRNVQALTKQKKPIHIIICLGRNEQLKRTIKTMQLPPHVTISIVGFTQRIADLMAVSDLIFTKPGPNSICEAKASNVPIIVDQTGGVLRWETLGIDLIEEWGIGESLKNFKDLNSKVSKFLDDPDYMENIKRNMTVLNDTNSFSDNIKILLDKILS